ncbi:MAG: SusC/RagA family TonB-linked outer membrane protein [Paludibacteraceae bacterium]|nr:SusC/RagA family TonB-linked outer membrane protein [Paludibacteraceae bacterium]
MMKHKLISLVALLGLWFMSAAAFAQVTGTVFEAATGEPIIGATVLEVGTSNGTVTDFDGNFVINVAPGTQIQISYIGFVSQTLAAQNGMVVRMAEETEQLEEVVVVGYGSQKKKEVTGSVASVKAEDFNPGVQANPAGLLQGKVAGLNITRSTSDPTSTGFDIQIRGFSTLDQGAGTSPLYIVDGVPVSGIDQIAPNDIASMDVLKDGSAAAIYGTRGTNGVIIITTKRGAGYSDQANTEVTYDGYVSAAWNNTKMGMATASDFRNLKTLTNGKLTGNDFGSTTDWISELTRTAALTHNHNLAVSGSHKNFSYRASINFKNAEGIAKVTNRQELMGKFAADQKALNGWLNMQYDLSYMHYRNDYFCGDFTQAATLNPTYPVYDQTSGNGYFVNFPINGQTNPVEGMNLKESYGDGNYFRGSVRATVNIVPVPGLKVSGFAALEEGDNHSFWANKNLLSAAYLADAGAAGRSNSNNFNQLYEATVDYAGSWGGHSLVGVAGFSYQHFFDDGDAITNQGFATYNIKYNSIGEGQADKEYLTVSSGRSTHTLAAGFLRLNYNYNEKYLVSASVRAEGSSRFGANNKWGYFPAVSAGWRIKGEDFMRSQDWCDELKLRVGFGMTGNDLKDNLKSVALLSKTDVVTMNGQDVYAYSVTQNVNPDLRWEKKLEYNVGVDYSFFKGRMYGSLDGYFRQTQDLLWYYEVPTPPYQYETLLANAGQMESYGFEVALSGVPVKTKDWNWTSTLTLAWNDNKITKLSDEAKGFNYKQTMAGSVSGNAFNSMQTQILIEGESVGTYYGYKFLGFDKAGNWLYENRYGEPCMAGDLVEADRQALGNAQPKVTYGWNNTVRWRDLDLTIFFRGVIGNKLLNVTRWQYTPDGTSSSTNQNVFMKDLNSGNGAAANGGAVFADHQHFSDYWLEDGSYLKCDNITLGYTFRFKDNNYIRSLRLTATGQNLFTISGYSGKDPEVSTTAVWSAGIDYVSFYPKTASVLFGVNLNLF